MRKALPVLLFVVTPLTLLGQQNQVDTVFNVENLSTPFSDFHIHLTFKHYYHDIKQPGEILSLSQAQIKEIYGKYNWKPFGENSKARRKGKESNCKNYNQSDFSTLGDVNGSVLCNSFYPFEKVMTVRSVDRLVNHLFVSMLPTSRLKQTAANNSSPYEEFLAEYNFAKNQQETEKGQTIKFAKNSEELRANIADNVTTYVMVVEGGQVLQGRYVSNDSLVRKWQCDGKCQEELLHNVKNIKNLDHRLFFIGTSHFAWNRISGQAKTLDKPGFRRRAISILARSTNLRKSMFLKWGEGIHGEIDAGTFQCYQQQNGYIKI